MQLLIPFLIYLVAEIYIFVTLGAETGPLFMILEVLVTGWVGFIILKRTGGHISNFARYRLARLQTLVKALGARLLSGVLFLLPGLLTDTIAAVLFCYSLYSLIKSAYTVLRSGSPPHRGKKDESASDSQSPQEVIEGNYTEKD